MKFELIKTDPGTSARRGRLHTSHGVVETPAFMPVGTQATVKGIMPEQLVSLGAEMILANAYHLLLRPGHEVVRNLGGLHRFMGWRRPILTDSGGYQIFSLSKFRKIDDEGVSFRSHLDGSAIFLSPELSVDVQVALGSDVIMVLDDCLAYPPEREVAVSSMRRSVAWARRCRARFDETAEASQALFGIVQGSTFPDLRAESAASLIETGFDGYAIGGLAVGEPIAEMYETVGRVSPSLPADQPRYLMGVGTPRDLVECVSRGIDMFDCVMPTRHARNGWLFVDEGHIVIGHSKYKTDERPIDPGCGCPVCGKYTRAYLRHLFLAREILSSVLNTIHNLSFYLDTMRKIRQIIESEGFSRFLAHSRKTSAR